MFATDTSGGRGMMGGAGILEGETAAPGNNSRRETRVVDGSSVLLGSETGLLASGETPVVDGDSRGRFCARLANLGGLLIVEEAVAL